MHGRGRVWQGGVHGRGSCIVGDMHVKGHTWWGGGACVAEGGMHDKGLCRRRYGHCSRRYAYHWNAFLL